MDFNRILVRDRSGNLYDIEKSFEVIFVKYNKRFYYCDQNCKNKIYEEFSAFVEKCRKSEGSPKRAPLRGRERIELFVDGMRQEMGFYVQEEENSYKCFYFLTLFAGLGVYYEIYMRRRVLRYEMDIVKEVFP